MKTFIYKYKLTTACFGGGADTYEQFNLPASSKIVKFHKDGSGQPCIWIEHTEDPDEATIRKLFRFKVVGTGHSWENDEYEYFDSHIDTNGFVWHLYHKTLNIQKEKND